MIRTQVQSMGMGMLGQRLLSIIPTVYSMKISRFFVFFVPFHLTYFLICFPDCFIAVCHMGAPMY
jgi:hypothetical protein